MQSSTDRNARGISGVVDEVRRNFASSELIVDCRQLEEELAHLNVKEKIDRAIESAGAHYGTVNEFIFRAIFICLLADEHLLLAVNNESELGKEEQKKHVKGAVADLIYTLSTLMELTIERVNLNQLTLNEDLVNSIFDPSSMPNILIIEGLDGSPLSFQRLIHEKLSLRARHTHGREDVLSMREEIFLCISIVSCVSNIYLKLRENFLLCLPLNPQPRKLSAAISATARTDSSMRYVSLARETGSLVFPLRLLKLLRRRHAPAVHVGLDVEQLIRIILIEFRTDPRVVRGCSSRAFNAYLSAVRALCALSGRGYATVNHIIVILVDVTAHRIDVKAGTATAVEVAKDIANTLNALV